MNMTKQGTSLGRKYCTFNGQRRWPSQRGLATSMHHSSFCVLFALLPSLPYAGSRPIAPFCPFYLLLSHARNFPDQRSWRLAALLSQLMQSLRPSIAVRFMLGASVTSSHRSGFLSFSLSFWSRSRVFVFTLISRALQFTS